MSGITICVLNGGPADGTELPTADHACTRRIVIYRTTGELQRPAVYLRDPSDQGTQSVVGLDGVAREFPTLGYVFERSVTWQLARDIEQVRRAESDAELADGGSL